MGTSAWQTVPARAEWARSVPQADAATASIVQATIALAHGLGIDVVAEGIETPEQLGRLQELACDRGQGYLYARPLPPDQLEALLMATSTEPVSLPIGGVDPA